MVNLINVLWSKIIAVELPSIVLVRDLHKYGSRAIIFDHKTFIRWTTVRLIAALVSQTT